MQRVNLGLVGAGTVGGGVFLALQRNGSLMASRLGAQPVIRRVAVRDTRRARKIRIPASLLTTDWRKVVNDPEIPLIAELMGGVDEAFNVVATALGQGKSVITANKALLSAKGPKLFEIAARSGANLYFEASVAGGIPIIKVLRESLAGNRISRLYGIVNGTCNYILSRMAQEGADFADVLADAQRLGFAEAEPSLDIDGHDAAHKTGILASLAHGFWVKPSSIHTEGIRHITGLDIEFARLLGYTIKLLGIVKETKVGKNGPPAVQVSVYPALIPDSHVLASVNGVFNAVFVRGDVSGETLYYGRGAGQDATASSVLSDIADAIRDRLCGSPRRVPAFVPHTHGGAVLPMDAAVSRYYLRLEVLDQPGVLARIATILGRARIGISSVVQPEGHEGRTIPLILMIHDATHRD
ncbi:MAG: homoserine dehydrogenase, partial [Verrucomicrobia bacterium]|nr:homoserine dehydrogenase [Verrucomicrobiota bacterium]